MSEMIMLVDTALSEVPVNIFPLTDDTDFKTREESVTYDQAGMDLVWNFVTTGGAYTQTAVTPTTGGVYDWTNQGNGMYTIEIPATGGASINNNTEGYGWFTGYATGILPWRSPIIQFSPDNVVNSIVNGSDYLDVNSVQVEGADATDQIRDSVVDDATRIDASALNTLSGHDPGATIAKAGDQMNLADDAITSAKYDESTAFPIKSADSGNTQIARTGADGDTLESLSDEISNVLTDLNTVLIDTNEIQTKLPTNNIMGSSVKTDKDDEIDAIKIQTDKMNFTGGDIQSIASNMRGTDGANTTVPDAAGTAATLHEITDGLLTAAGVLIDAIKAKTDDLTFTTANKIDARVDYVGANAVTSPDDMKADVSNLDATVSSRSSHSAADIWSSVARTLTDKTDFSLSTANINTIVSAIADDVITDLADEDVDIGATITRAKIERALFNRFFREVIQTATNQSVSNDDGNVIANMTCSEIASTSQTKGGAQ